MLSIKCFFSWCDHNVTNVSFPFIAYLISLFHFLDWIFLFLKFSITLSQLLHFLFLNSRLHYLDWILDCSCCSKLLQFSEKWSMQKWKKKLSLRSALRFTSWKVLHIHVILVFIVEILSQGKYTKLSTFQTHFRVLFSNQKSMTFHRYS